jgi:tight adherence protein C
MAWENRDMRTAEAEKKAAALPPKLTVPMIGCFFTRALRRHLGPVIIQVFKYN